MAGTDAHFHDEAEAVTLDPAACNALTQTASGLLVPRTVLEGIAPGGTVGTARSVDVDITDTGGQNCPDTWQVGARLSAVSGEATLAAAVDLAAGAGTYVPTPLTITLPEPGRYQLHWNVLGQICATNPVNAGSNRWIQARVVNAATGAPLGPVRTVIQHQYAASIAIQSCVDATAPIDHQVTVTAASLTLRLEAVLFGPTGTVQSAVVHGGQTTVTMHKISD